MCLFKGKHKVQIADDDIECYKVLQFNLRSIYYNWQYELNKLYSKKWDEEFIEYANTHRELGGNLFHACLSKEMCITLYGLSYDQLTDDAQLDETQILVKCIIPKGSRYYKGSSKEIGAEQIIIKEICR